MIISERYRSGEYDNRQSSSCSSQGKCISPVVLRLMSLLDRKDAFSLFEVSFRSMISVLREAKPWGRLVVCGPVLRACTRGANREDGPREVKSLCPEACLGLSRIEDDGDPVVCTRAPIRSHRNRSVACFLLVMLCVVCSAS